MKEMALELPTWQRPKSTQAIATCSGIPLQVGICHLPTVFFFFQWNQGCSRLIHRRLMQPCWLIAVS